jgi:hypothetical protein
MANPGMTTDTLDEHLVGARQNGELRRQATAHNPFFSQLLHDLLLGGTSMPPFNVEELIAITLLKFPTRKATVSQIAEIARSLPYFQRLIAGPNCLDRPAVGKLVRDMEQYLIECRVKFDVHFPPVGYQELCSMPGDSKPEALKKWLAKVGVEIAEEEDNSSKRYQFEYIGHDWKEPFDEEYDNHRSEGNGSEEYIYVLPPGQENIILGRWYPASGTDDIPPLLDSSYTAPKNQVMLARNANSPHKPVPGTSPLLELPDEIKVKILGFLLLLPGKIRVTAEVEDDGTEPVELIDRLPASTYKFHMAVKAPPFLISPLPMHVPGQYHGHYWSLEQPVTFLAICAVNKEFRHKGREVFYCENYFEVLDDDMDRRIKHVSPGNSWPGNQLAHPWLDLMSQSKARDGFCSYGEPPLKLIRRLNLDHSPWCGDDDLPAQMVWHFERIINAIISIPHLEKLVINVRVTFLEQIDYLGRSIYNRPAIWPGFKKLPWGKSKPKVYIPEHREAQLWLQKLIDEEDNKGKAESMDGADWSTHECPSLMIREGIEDANERHILAFLFSVEL